MRLQPKTETKKKPPSAKAKAAKAKREKMGVKSTAIEGPLTDVVRQRLEDSFERSYGGDDVPWDVGDSYPSTTGMTEDDILAAEEAVAAEEQLLGKRGVPHDDKCSAATIEGGICSCSAGV